MMFPSVNYVAVVLAAIAAFVFGAVFYTVFSKPWMSAARIAPSGTRMMPAPSLLITSFVCELIMAWVLAALLGHAGAAQVSVGGAVASAFVLWLGFIATTLAVNHRYQSYGWDLTVIDGLHWLGVVLLMGAIIGWFGGPMPVA